MVDNMKNKRSLYVNKLNEGHYTCVWIETNDGRWASINADGRLLIVDRDSSLFKQTLSEIEGWELIA